MLPTGSMSRHDRASPIWCHAAGLLSPARVGPSEPAASRAQTLQNVAMQLCATTNCLRQAGSNHQCLRHHNVSTTKSVADGCCRGLRPFPATARAGLFLVHLCATAYMSPASHVCKGRACAKTKPRPLRPHRCESKKHGHVVSQQDKLPDCHLRITPVPLLCLCH